MAEEFTPEASVDFETLAAAAAAMTNGDGPAYAPPPPIAPTPAPASSSSSAPRNGRSLGLDPFEAIEKIVGDQQLMYRELGDINAKLSILQLQTVLAFGAALLIAVVIYQLKVRTPPA